MTAESRHREYARAVAAASRLERQYSAQLSADYIEHLRTREDEI